MLDAAGELTGPIGGIIAIAWAAGAVSGYAFCLRTMYKVVKGQAEKDEKECNERIDDQRREIDRLIDRCDTKQRQIDVLQERLVLGMARETAQVRESGMYLIEHGKVKRTFSDDGSEDQSV